MRFHNAKRLILLVLVAPIVHAFQTSLTTVVTAKPRRSTAILSSRIVNFQNDTVAAPTTLWTEVRRQDHVDRLQRSSVAAVSCVTTWMMTTYAGLSIIQASSLQGILASLALSPTWAVASFCGSFAGMSGQIHNLSQALQLGTLCALVFATWDRYKVGVGKGGRLGTIAFLANCIHYSISQSSFNFVWNTLQQIRPATAAGLLLAGATLQWSSRQSTSSPNSAARWIKTASKVALASILMTRVVTTTNAPYSLLRTIFNSSALLPTLQNALAMFVAAWTVRSSKGVVLPVSLVGLAGSFLGTAWAAPIYLGAFVGMTGLAGFRTWNLAQASFFSSLLYSLDVFGGFGGKLGFLAFLGVNLGK